MCVRVCVCGWRILTLTLMYRYPFIGGAILFFLTKLHRGACVLIYGTLEHSRSVPGAFSLVHEIEVRQLGFSLRLDMMCGNGVVRNDDVCAVQ
jgi:hypothetical protein